MDGVYAKQAMDFLRDFNSSSTADEDKCSITLRQHGGMSLIYNKWGRDHPGECILYFNRRGDFGTVQEAVAKLLWYAAKHPIEVREGMILRLNLGGQFITYDDLVHHINVTGVRHFTISSKATPSLEDYSTWFDTLILLTE